MLTRILVIVFIAIVAGTVVTLINYFKVPIRKWAMRMSAKLTIKSLRKAVQQADAIKSTTGRKAIVVFNKTTNEYEAIEKKILKRAANNSKGKTNRFFTHDRVKLIQKKSLYVTR